MRRQFKTHKDQSGSALVLALITVVLMGITAIAAMEISRYINNDAAYSGDMGNINALANSVTLLLSEPQVCLNGLDSTQAGLQFENNAGMLARFNPGLAASPNGQLVRFGTNFSSSFGGLLTLRSNIDVPDFGFRITRLYMKAGPAPAAPQYQGEIYAQLETINMASGKPALADKLLSTVDFAVDGTGAVTGCRAQAGQTTASEFCQSMGCNYNANAIGQKCQCPLPPAQCGQGSYIAGLDDNTMQAICKPAAVACASGQYLAGIKSDLQPVCVTVGTAPTPTPTPSNPYTLYGYILSGGVMPSPIGPLNVRTFFKPNFTFPPVVGSSCPNGGTWTSAHPTVCGSNPNCYNCMLGPSSPYWEAYVPMSACVNTGAVPPALAGTTCIYQGPTTGLGGSYGFTGSTIHVEQSELGGTCPAVTLTICP